MVWEKSNQHGGFSKADATWLPVSSQHLQRAGLDMAQTDGSIINNLRNSWLGAKISCDHECQYDERRKW